MGGKPIYLDGDGIKEHSITSNGFFELNDLPKKSVVVGDDNSVNRALLLKSLLQNSTNASFFCPNLVAIGTNGTASNNNVKLGFQQSVK